MKKLNFITLLLIIISVDIYASAVASLTALRGTVDVQREQKNFDAVLGMKLLEKDYIQTQDNSKAQIIFKDDTVISVGKNSNFSIEEYLFDENSEPVAKFNMISGAMRTITGKIGQVAPHKFNVSTKTATIGIRGTNFTVVAEQDGRVDAYCTYGTITSSFNNQEYVIEQGYYISILPSGIVNIQEFTVGSLRQMRQRRFGIVIHDDSSTTKESDTKTVLTTSQSETDSSANIDSTENVDGGENTSQIESSYADNSGVVTQSVKENNTDNILSQDNIATLDSIIAQHSMQRAVYYGSYSTITNSGTLMDTGDTKLAIDFSQDTALLEMGSFQNEEPQVSYNFSHVDSGYISGTQSNGNGVADGTFYGPEGNIVRGKFTYEEGNQITAQGAYNTQTFQELH